MTHPRKTLLQTLQTRALAILNGSDAAFPRCWLVPDIESGLARVRRIPRFPTALLTSGNLVKHRHNNKLETFTVEAAVVHLSVRDHMAEKPTEDVLDLLDLLLEGDGTNPGLKYDLGTGTPVVARAQGEGAVTSNQGGVELVYAAAALTVKLQRS